MTQQNVLPKASLEASGRLGAPWVLSARSGRLLEPSWGLLGPLLGPPGGAPGAHLGLPGGSLWSSLGLC